MKLHQQFDLNEGVLRVDRMPIQKSAGRTPVLVERLVRMLAKRGYTVIESSIRFMGVPQSITVTKDFTGPFASLFSAKITNDFRSISNALGIGKLFD